MRFDSQEPARNEKMSIWPPVNPIKTGKFRAGRTLKKTIPQTQSENFNSDSNSSSGCSTGCVRKKLASIALRGTKVTSTEK